MTSKDGLAKDGLSYRSDIFTMDILTAIYVYACILWIVLLITVIFNSIHTRPVKQKKQKDFELLHVSSDRQKSGTAPMSYTDSKSFRSDRDKWERTKSESSRRASQE
ncbi:hypothetical protein RB195_011404 [Necator americanus]|uniref:Uncharacterized protein n=1 Tax=Necator americanus TaxID=51031 RepID=A0ABR1D423_NECAM